MRRPGAVADDPAETWLLERMVEQELRLVHAASGQECVARCVCLDSTTKLGTGCFGVGFGGFRTAKETRYASILAP